MRTAQPELLALLETLARRRHPLVARDEMRSLAAEAVSRALAHPPPDGQWRPWIFRTFDNALVDHVRRLTARHRNATLVPQLAPTDPETQLLCRERDVRVASALADLPEAWRTPVRLRYIDRQDCATISRTLGIAPATVRTRVHRGLRALRAQLAGLRVVVWPFSAGLKASPAAAVVMALWSPLLSWSPPQLAQAASLQTRMAMTDVPALFGQVVDAPAQAERRASAGPFVPEATDADPAPTVIIFDGDLVDGDREQPDGVLISADTPADHGSLIEIPSSLVPALLKSLEDL